MDADGDPSTSGHGARPQVCFAGEGHRVGDDAVPGIEARSEHDARIEDTSGRESLATSCSATDDGERHCTISDVD